MTNQDLVFSTQPHLLRPGLLAAYLDESAAEVAAAGHTSLTIGGYLTSIAHFGQWAQGVGITVEDIDDKAIAAFATHRCKCPGGRKYKRVSHKYLARVKRFVHYLRQRGVASASEDAPLCNLQPTLAQFRDWLLHHRGLSVHTIERYEGLISKLQPLLGNDVAQYDAATVRRVVLAEAGRHSCAHAKCVVTALRAYFRFLASEGQCHPGLDQAVPTVAQWKLSALPRYLVADDVGRVIASCDLSKPWRAGPRRLAVVGTPRPAWR